MKKPRPKLIQQCKWMGEEVPVDTPEGQISYKEWLEREAERIRANPGRIAVIRKNGLLIALFVNPQKKKKSGEAVDENADPGPGRP